MGWRHVSRSADTRPAGLSPRPRKTIPFRLQTANYFLTLRRLRGEQHGLQRKAGQLAKEESGLKLAWKTGLGSHRSPPPPLPVSWEEQEDKEERISDLCLPHPIPTSLSGDPISPVPTVQPIAQCPWTVTGPRASDSSARRRRDKQGLSLASGHAGCGKDPTRSGGRLSGWNWRGVGRDKSFIFTQVPMGGGPCPSLFLSTKNVPLVRNDALWTLTLWSNANSQGFPERDGVVTSCNEFSPFAFSA